MEAVKGPQLHEVGIENPLLSGNSPENGSSARKRRKFDISPIRKDDVDELQRKQQLLFLLKEKVKAKKEKLRKLKLVHFYRNQNEIEDIDGLVDKWKKVCQEALLELHSKMNDPKPTLTQVIDHLQIEHSFIEYDTETEEFAE